jgi:NADPH2:quinone reductase
LLAWIQEQKLKPLISATYPLEQAGEALRRLAAREAVGKMVITIGE